MTKPNQIAFIDLEVDPRTSKIFDIGGIKDNNSVYHSSATNEILPFLEGIRYLCGHNIFKHDLPYLQKVLPSDVISRMLCIDTLYWGPLLFPQRPYHKLLKDDKLQTDELNNPVNDSRKAKDLFYDELAAFAKLEDSFKRILFQLLGSLEEFEGFFKFAGYTQKPHMELSTAIKQFFSDKICSNVELSAIVKDHPRELAYALCLTYCSDRYSITPPWVLRNFPEVDRIMYLLRGSACLPGCKYCDINLDGSAGLKRFFGYDSFRKFDGQDLQKLAVDTALIGESLLAVFPTGGGKSLTFQIPALLAGENTKALTVVISPLQSLMKDQVDNLEKHGITESATINGMLDPIERSKSFERVQDGSVSLLYISPESLRSKTIENLLLGRRIERFVIDEAHCFSSWGQDFRVDYLYIADFIKSLARKKQLSDPIPVSCFTATAKKKVIEDICSYFEENLGLKLEVFTTNSRRTNLTYKVFHCRDADHKYNHLRSLIESKNCPTIVYVSRTKLAKDLSERLSHDGFVARPFHGKMDQQEKVENQNLFIKGEVDVMVATSAFGMGVDKKDVKLVVHYEISDSLENYVQEAGRAGRDASISADCYVLYNEDDLDKHFVLLNQTKLSVKEIQDVWKSIKYVTKYRSTVSNSALELAREAGWDDSVYDIETRVKTAIAALENAGYVQRGHNVPRVFANSILAKNAQVAIEIIQQSSLFTDKQKGYAVRIIKKLFSTRSRKHASDEIAESRVDYISDHLGISKHDVIRVISLLREEGILADNKDLTAYIKLDEGANRSLSVLRTFSRIESFLIDQFSSEERVYNLKELNEEAECAGIDGVNPSKIVTILNYWTVKKKINKRADGSMNHVSVGLKEEIEVFREYLQSTRELAQFIVEYLHQKIDTGERTGLMVLVEFSIQELKERYQNQNGMFIKQVSVDLLEDALFYLSRIGAVKIEGGFLVVYNKLTIERLEKNNKIQYKKEDYQNLENFYNSKSQQIHIVGEYANKLLKDYESALNFVDDYFQLNYSSFLRKHFPGQRGKDITNNISPKKFKKIFGALSPAQMKIINDNVSQNIVVAAGPGSGKTRVLVHKLASLLLMENVKHEQLLMLTFSRAAATEFKRRLLSLIGNAAYYVEIRTFHSLCFDLLGRVGNIENAATVVGETVKRINNREIEPNRIMKSVLVIDEAQDMDSQEYSLVKAIVKKNDGIRIIAVGDDDQNIYEFRGSDSKHLKALGEGENAEVYELVENYRSAQRIVFLSNQFAKGITNRLKKLPVAAVRGDLGEVEIRNYTSNNLIKPLVSHLISRDLSGTTAVLTKTNDEALFVSGLLSNHDVANKLIQSQEGFNISHIKEVHQFIQKATNGEHKPIIDEDGWKKAKQWFKTNYSASSLFDLVTRMIASFESVNKNYKYLSDFQMYLEESQLEDFAETKPDEIVVSTIHKAKGKEFDNVFLLLDRFNVTTDKKKRQLYVAMTRAKNLLSIHLNTELFNDSIENGIKVFKDVQEYSIPERIVLNLSHRDVNLGYFKFIQRRVYPIISGNNLELNAEGLMNNKHEQVVKFSNSFKAQLTSLSNSGYKPVSATVNYVLFWRDKEDDKEYQIILPKISLTKIS